MESRGIRRNLIVLASLLLLGLGSCTYEGGPSPDPVHVVGSSALQAHVRPDGSLLAVELPDGTRVDETTQLETAIAAWASNGWSEGDTIELRFVETPQLFEEDGSNGSDADADTFPIYLQVPWTDIGVRISTERHFIGGCIRRYDVWHAHLALNYYRGPNQGRQIINYHLAFWINERGQPCSALYESVSGACWGPYCGPSYRDLTGVVAGALAAYVGWTVANAVANIVVPVVLGLATVVPGVPPPP